MGVTILLFIGSLLIGWGTNWKIGLGSFLISFTICKAVKFMLTGLASTLEVRYRTWENFGLKMKPEPPEEPEEEGAGSQVPR